MLKFLKLRKKEKKNSIFILSCIESYLLLAIIQINNLHN